MQKIQPLAYVVVELRVPFTPRLATLETAERMTALLPDLNVTRQEKRQRVVQEGDNVRLEVEEGWRLSDLGQTRSLILTSSSVVYETTHYPGFEDYLRDFRACLDSVTSVARPVGYDRLGLRYVNEVWPPGPIEKFDDWGKWVAPQLVSNLVASEPVMASGDVRGIDPKLIIWESGMRYSLPDNCALTLNLASKSGKGVVGNDPLKRRQTPASDGPYFVIDFDGYWPRERTDVRVFDADEVCGMLRTVHSPVKAGFRWATTPQFIDEVGVSDVYK